jgi:hypothetical protein
VGVKSRTDRPFVFVDALHPGRPRAQAGRSRRRTLRRPRERASRTSPTAHARRSADRSAAARRRVSGARHRPPRRQLGADRPQRRPPDISNAPSPTPANRRIASGTRAGGRSDRPSLLWSGTGRPPGVQPALGIDRRREPQRSAITSQLASPTRRPTMFRPRHRLQAFRPSVRIRAKEEGIEPPSVHQIGTKPPGWWDNPVEVRHRPRSQNPVTQASRLVAQAAPLVASRLGPKILAAGPARVRLYSYRGLAAWANLKRLGPHRRDEMIKPDGEISRVLPPLVKTPTRGAC